MNVLVIGDGHTYGYGLSSGQLSYVGHFIRQISHTGQSVSVEAYAHLSMPQVLSTLTRLPLDRYDLILLQLDYLLAQSATDTKGQQALISMLPMRSEKPALPHMSARGGLTQQVKSFRSMVNTIRLIRPRRTYKFLSALLKQLRPYRHSVLLLTPLPHRGLVQGWLRKQSRALLLEEAGDQLFSVFDTSSVILPHDEYYMPNEHEYLNAVSHELLGRSLYDFYQSAPTIVTIQAIKRNGDDFWPR
jgi:hypothetical protein